MRENAESVSLLRREPHLVSRLVHTIDALTANLRRIVAVNRNLGFFTTGYNYMVQLIPVLIVAPLFIRGEAEFGQIPQASMAFAHLVGAFSLVVNQFGQLSSYAAVLARLSALGEAADTAAASGAREIAVAEDGRRLAIERLTLRTPQDARVLVRALSLDLAPGARGLVVGPEDATVALGRVVRPADVMFLPDRPYLPPGTLRELLAGTARVGEQEVWTALRTAGVEPTVLRVGGLDVALDWDTALSLREQRLLEIARMLLAAPSVVVLEHLVTGLDGATAAATRAALSARGIGLLALEDAVPDVMDFDEVVQIAPDGSWTRPGARAATG